MQKSFVCIAHLTAAIILSFFAVDCREASARKPVPEKHENVAQAGDDMTPADYFQKQQSEVNDAAKQAALTISKPLTKSPDEYAQAAHLAKSENLPNAVIEPNYKTFAARMIEKKNEIFDQALVTSKINATEQSEEVPLIAKLTGAVMLVSILACVAYLWKIRRKITSGMLSIIIWSGAKSVVLVRKWRRGFAELRTVIFAKADEQDSVN